MPHRSTVLLIAGSVGVLGTCLWFAFRGPVITVWLENATIESPVFRIRTSGINSVMSIYVWSETTNEALWAVQTSRRLPIERFTFGEVPPEAEQTYPKGHRAPRKIRAGERFVVSVAYQYDTYMAASGASHFFRFEANSTGAIRASGNSANIPGPYIPVDDE